MVVLYAVGDTSYIIDGLDKAFDNNKSRVNISYRDYERFHRA